MLLGTGEVLYLGGFQRLYHLMQECAREKKSEQGKNKRIFDQETSWRIQEQEVCGRNKQSDFKKNDRGT